MLNNSTPFLLPLLFSNTGSASAGITQQARCKKPISCSKHPVGCRVLAETSKECNLSPVRGSCHFLKGCLLFHLLIMQQVLEVAAFQVYLLLNTCKSGCFQLRSLLSCSGLWALDYHWGGCNRQMCFLLLGFSA